MSDRSYNRNDFVIYGHTGSPQRFLGRVLSLYKSYYTIIQLQPRGVTPNGGVLFPVGMRWLVDHYLVYARVTNPIDVPPLKERSLALLSTKRFSVGMRVRFTNKKGYRENGVIERVNQKTCTCRADNAPETIFVRPLLITPYFKG